MKKTLLSIASLAATWCFTSAFAEPEKAGPKVSDFPCCHTGQCCGIAGCCDDKGCNSADCPSARTKQKNKEAAAEVIDQGIQGKWKVVALEFDGIKAPAEIVKAMTLTFKDDTLTFAPAEPGYKTFSFRLTPDLNPAGFDMTNIEGGEGEHKSKQGSYELDGDILRICIGSNKRPAELSSKQGTGNAMYTLKRMKP